MFYFLTFFIALITTFIFTPAAAWFAQKINILDHPNYRKIHKKAKPLLGGLAVFLGFILALFVSDLSEPKIILLILGGVFMLILGIIDDKFALKATIKFILPLFASLVLIIEGLNVGFTPLKSLNVWFTLFWLLAITNAFNFIDNMDGLASGVALIASISFTVLAILSGQTSIALVALALAGSCLGFLFFNFHPAKVFLGDAGSMFIGYTLAGIVVLGCWKTGSILELNKVIPPVLILGYPIFDAFFVIIHRILNKRLPWVADKKHTSHRLLYLGYSQKKAALIVYGICFVLGLMGILAYFSNLKILLAVLGFLVLSFVFSYFWLSKIRGSSFVE